MSKLKWNVKYVDGKPIACGFSSFDGNDVRSFDDIDPGILDAVVKSKKTKDAARSAARAAVLAKIKTALALTDAEVKALFGGG